jgi:2-keto-4-pentenoate hydratase/2-oxohepta-3-ene-1,7-dioic acid hydratase in catechol pathway
LQKNQHLSPSLQKKETLRVGANRGKPGHGFKNDGVTKQDGNTKNLIFDEAHMLRYLTSVLTLYPGDVVVTGTPDGVGAARRPPEYLKPGDEVVIEIEGIGVLKTPMRAASERK